MSNSGPRISQLFSKYEQKVQLPKFLAIAQAEEAGDDAKVNSLMDSFSGNDEQMFALFIEDLGTIGSHQDSQAAKLEQLKLALEAKNAEIEVLEQKRGAVLNQYEQGMGNAVGSFTTNQRHASTSSANTSHQNGKKGGCNIM